MNKINSWNSIKFVWRSFGAKRDRNAINRTALVLWWNQGPPLEPLDHWRRWSVSAEKSRTQSWTIGLIVLERMFCVGPIFGTMVLLNRPGIPLGNLSWGCRPRFYPFMRVKQATLLYVTIAQHSKAVGLLTVWSEVSLRVVTQGRYVFIHIIRIALCTNCYIYVCYNGKTINHHVVLSSPVLVPMI